MIKDPDVPIVRESGIPILSPGPRYSVLGTLLDSRLSSPKRVPMRITLV
jgi:hypothetical protein